MRISVISFNGAPPARPSSHDFDSRGGAIGREEGNELVLPDPERHISRVQARIECEGGRFMIVDQGGNPSSVNDRPVGRGNRVELVGGDRIAIGGYLLEVEFDRAPPVFSTPAPAPASADPLGLFGGAPVADPFADSLPSPDTTPVAAFGGASSVPPAPGGDDPFAVFAAPVRAAPAPEPEAAPFPDPFAAPPPPSAPPPRADLLGLGGTGSEPSVDALFGLGAGGRDPFAGTPLGETPVTPSDGPAGAVDPLALFGAAAPAAELASPQRDDAPLLNQAFTPPRPEPAAGLEVTRVIAPRAVPPAGPSPAVGMVFSWDSPAAGPDSAPPPPAMDAPVAAPAVAPPKAEVNVERVAAGAAPAADVALTPRVAASAAEAELLDAFLRGLGVPLRLPDGLTPKLMEQIGVVLREATQGTLDLLTARALTKREVRAEVTMIVSKGNNPLKFSPDVGFALTQLLAPQGRGFMSPEAAMHDAYDDLRAHQFGFMAGMRAALAGVLKRFEPGALEQRVVSRSVLDSLLPGGRKARLWDLFEQMYGDISKEAEDDFHALFGKEFLRAYEEQVERLQAEREPGRPESGRS